MAKPTLLPDPTCLHLQLLDASTSMITLVVTTTSEEAECPLCHRCSSQIHSRYVRQIADLPWIGCAVRLQLHVRRFFCSNSECARQIFTERLPSVVAPYARRTTRLTEVLTLIGFALGGEAGKRLASGMSLVTSPDTLLRLIRTQPEEQIPTPRVLGVDDFSFCKRKTYGTILLDLERRIPIDLLPDREAATLVKWLKEHAGVEIISRDRGGPYAEGARLGAPEAQQVADRWHLLSNLSETLKGFFLNKKAQLDALVQKPAENLSEEEASQLTPWYAGTALSKRQEEKSMRLHQERVDLYHQIHDLYARKVDPANIARQVGISRQSVYAYLKRKEPPARTRIHRQYKPLIEPYKEYLIKRWNEGCRNAQLMRDYLRKVNPVKSDEQRKTSQECRARRCCLPCGPAKSTTGVKAKTSAPSHSTPHLRGLDIPWCVTSNPPGEDAERAAADGRHTTTGLAHGRQDGGMRGLSGDSSRKAPCPPTWWCYGPSCCASRRACSSARSRTSACKEAFR